ncbi:hypothetical protein [Kitasatospora sp. NBC_01266]|uniref:hypothetical protein n=1 Tax=Kitasatospora sp. NBC_01266 TaxID=2903572 RepID=UPI002E30C263|nr:hypothetical protein [Kitasatospora sp. NBC_01266]
MYSPGDVVAATLHDLAGMPGWMLTTEALVIAEWTFRETNLILLIQNRHGHAHMFARGTLSTALDTGRPTIEQPVTTGPTPVRIVLGDVTGRYDKDLTALDDQARADLASYWVERRSGPLTTRDLPALDIAMADIQRHRDEVTEAEARRDRLVRRLIAGGVERKAIARPGLSTSRISQINNEAPTSTTG